MGARNQDDLRTIWMADPAPVDPAPLSGDETTQPPPPHEPWYPTAAAGGDERDDWPASPVIDPMAQGLTDARTVGGSAPPLPEAVTKPEPVKPRTLINNNYSIIELINAGGMGEVYRGANIFTGDPVAVKIILPELAQDQAVLELFMREARLLVQLRDDAIVRYHNYVFDSGLRRYCLVMEFVEGHHLGDYLKHHGALSKADAVTIFRRIGRGLYRAHESGVVHRDLSPDNVILRHGHPAEAVLIDFGIARSGDHGDHGDQRFAGKYRHIAPEQLGHFGGVIDARSDIYSLGLLLAAMVLGEPLPMGTTSAEAMAARLRIPNLSGVPSDLFPLLQYMLEPDPRARPADLGVVLAMLDDPALLPARYRVPLWLSPDDAGIADDPTDNPFLNSPPPIRPAPRPNRSGLTRWAMGSAAVLATGAIIAAGWMVLPRSEPSPKPVMINAPVGFPARDPTTREGFLASQSLPPCTVASRINTGVGAGTIRVLSDQDIHPVALADAWRAAFATEPAFSTARLDTGFCPAVGFLAAISGYSAIAPVLSVTGHPTTTGVQISGEIVVPAQQSLWFFLVTPQGGIHDLTAQLSPDDGGARRFGLNLANPATGPQDYLLVALTSDTALTTLAAAPAAARADSILPAVLDELRQAGQPPGVDFMLISSADEPLGG